MIRAVVLISALVLGAAACGGGGNAREEAMTRLADETIIPTYRDVNDKALALTNQLQQGCSADSRTAAKDLRAAWAKSEAMWIGPVMTDRISAQVDYPIDPASVDKLLADLSLTLNQDTVAKRAAANARGLGAVEYLVSGPEPIDQRRCDYALAAAQVLQASTKKAFDAWTTGDDNYRDMFVGTGEGADVNKSVDSLVNDTINTLHKISDQEIQAALGRNGQPGDITKIQEGVAGEGVAFDRGRVQGVRTVLIGANNDGGLAPLLDSQQVQRLNESFNNADAALAKIDGPLRAAITADRADVEQAKAAIDAVRTIVSTEVVSKLGVTVGFSDADGDSAG